MSFWKWSRTAANNATADGSINWAQDQASSMASDSARDDGGGLEIRRRRRRRDRDGGHQHRLYAELLPGVFDTLARRDFALARNAVADDMAHVLRSGGMSEDDIRAWKDALESSASADELKAVIGRGIEHVNARLADLQARYRRGAKAPPELLSPKSKATLDRLRQWTAPAAGSK